MKDINIHITRRRLRTELAVMAVCLAIGVGLNVWAIASYGAKWTELVTSLGYVLVFAAALYAATALVRLAIAAVAAAWRTKGRRQEKEK